MALTQQEIESLRATRLDNLEATLDGRQILTCMQCGTCVGTCPYGDVMPYPPRRIIRMIQAGRLEEVIRSGSALKCVLCYACMEKCPRDIKLGEVLLPLVKEQTLSTLPQIPAELQRSLENTLRYGNPMGESPRKRAAWIKDAGVPVPVLAEIRRPVDVLWFVECYPSYYPRGQAASRAAARLMHALGIDFAILGNEEKCAGECGRLTWEPGLFDTLMDYNMAIFQKYRFNRIVTGDPHAYTAFRGRYSVIGGFDYPLEHLIPMLASRLGDLKPLLRRKLDYTVTYHDSCCLGRHFHFYEEPRALLAAIPGVRLVEMTHHRVNSICCGGGGGGMWLDTYFKEQGMERLSDRRVAEALATGADVLAIACPYEVSRFEDAVKLAGAEGRLKVRDITELLVEAMGEGEA